MHNILVSDLMTRDPICVKPETDLLSCARNMVKKRVGTLLLAEKGKLLGVLSRKDILWALVKKSKDDLSKIKAIAISPKKIATIKPTSTILEAFSKMKKFKLEKLPVIHENKLVGMVTARDIFTFKPELYPELEEFAQIREESEKLKRIKKTKREGVCEECGRFDFLSLVHGELLCENCKESL